MPMQRLLFLKHASNLSKKLSDGSSSSSTTIFSHHYKTFSTLSNTSHQQPQHIFSNFTSPNLWRLSNPVIVKQFLRNPYIKDLSKGGIDSRFWFLRRNSFQINNPEFRSYSRTWKSWLRRLSGNDVVLGLILANVAVFMLWRIADHNFMMDNFTISLDNFKSGRVHTMITSAFSHIDTVHIVSNMIGLYFFGTNITRSFGPDFLLKLYLAGAVVGSVFYLIHHAYMAQTSQGRGFFMDPSRMPGLGASGAVNAIMLLDIFLFPRSTLYLEFIIPVPAILLGIFLIGKDMLRIMEGDTQISGSAHLGGAVVAAIAWARIRKGLF